MKVASIIWIQFLTSKLPSFFLWHCHMSFFT
jgi:hypothetical protein